MGESRGARVFDCTRGNTPSPLLLIALLLPLLLGAAPPPPPSRPTPPPAPAHLRTAVEVALGLAAGTAWYVIDDRNVLDWDSPALEQRFTGEAWRFDNNGFDMNFVLHPLTGAGTLVLARSNQLGFWPSAGYSLGTSLLWEYVIEFKEKVSINDVIVTTGGGLPIGEFFHKLGTYLHSAPAPSPGRAALQWSLGTAVAMHRAMDGPSQPPARLDSLGLDADIWHQFDLGYAPRVVQRGDDPAFWLHQLRAHGQLVSMKGYLTAPRMSRWFHQAEVSRFDLSLQHSSRGAGANLDADLLLAGHHSQALELSSGEVRQGHAATAALGLSYRYRHTTASGLDDRQGILRLPGPVLETLFVESPFSSRLSVRAHPSFAGISTLAFPFWRAAVPAPTTKTITDRHGYFFGWGWSATIAASIGVGPVELSGSCRLDRIDSQEGWDRTQEKVEVDVDLDERLVELGIELRVDVPGTPFAVGGAVERTRRASLADGRRTDVLVNAAGWNVSARF